MATITLDQWVDQFQIKRGATRALWKAIRWEFEEQNQESMTVRQMFYRMSSTGQVAKTEGGYRQVQRALTEMRRAGAIPYGWIADNTRWVTKPHTYASMADMLDRSHELYRRELWANQADHIEIWLEKDALRGIFAPITDQYDVGLYVTRGYPSITYLHGAAESLNDIDKPCYVYHFGDFDASGKDAARSIREGLRRFGVDCHFTEVAVTRSQIDELSLQTRPAKGDDPRAANWGKIAVELDAIPPATLRTMVRETIERHIDLAALALVKKIEESERAALAGFITQFGTSTKSVS